MGDPQIATWEQRRLSFGAAAADYDRYRPGYPAVAVAFAAGTTPGHVLDLGAGTGLLSAALLAAGHTVTAVEPDVAMGRLARTRVPGRVAAGTAEAIPLGDASVDAVVVGQAFHWFDAPAALAEIHRVLRPGGQLGLLWNVRDDTEDWAARLDPVGRVATTSQPRQRHPPFPGFAPVDTARFTHTHVLTPPELVGLVATMSWVRLHPRFDELVDQTSALVATHPALAGRARVAVRYRTDVLRARRDG